MSVEFKSQAPIPLSRLYDPQMSRRDALGTLGTLPVGISSGFGLLRALIPAAQATLSALAPASPSINLPLAVTAIGETLWPSALKPALTVRTWETPLFLAVGRLLERVFHPCTTADVDLNRLSFDRDILKTFASLAHESKRLPIPSTAHIAQLHALLCPEDIYFQPTECVVFAKETFHDSTRPFLPVAIKGEDGSFEDSFRQFLGDKEPTEEQRARWLLVLEAREKVVASLLAAPELAPLLTARIEDVYATECRSREVILEQVAFLRKLGPSRIDEHGTFFADDADELERGESAPIVRHSREECIDTIRSYVRSLHFFFKMLPELLEKVAADYPAGSVGEGLLGKFSTQRFAFVQRLNPAALNALSQYYHAAAEVLKHGKSGQVPLDEYYEKLAERQRALAPYDIPADPRLENNLRNPCRVLTRAPLSSQISARATSSPVKIEIYPEGATLHWLECGEERVQPLAPNDTRTLQARYLSRGNTLHTLTFPRGSRVQEGVDEKSVELID